MPDEGSISECVTGITKNLCDSETLIGVLLFIGEKYRFGLLKEDLDRFVVRRGTTISVLFVCAILIFELLEGCGNQPICACWRVLANNCKSLNQLYGITVPIIHNKQQFPARRETAPYKSARVGIGVLPFSGTKGSGIRGGCRGV